MVGALYPHLSESTPTLSQRLDALLPKVRSPDAARAWVASVDAMRTGGVAAFVPTPAAASEGAAEASSLWTCEQVCDLLVLVSERLVVETRADRCL